MCRADGEVSHLSAAPWVNRRGVCTCVHVWARVSGWGFFECVF